MDICFISIFIFLLCEYVFAFWTTGLLAHVMCHSSPMHVEPILMWCVCVSVPDCGGKLPAARDSQELANSEHPLVDGHAGGMSAARRTCHVGQNVRQAYRRRLLEAPTLGRDQTSPRYTTSDKRWLWFPSHRTPSAPSNVRKQRPYFIEGWHNTISFKLSTVCYLFHVESWIFKIEDYLCKKRRKTSTEINKSLLNTLHLNWSHFPKYNVRNEFSLKLETACN